LTISVADCVESIWLHIAWNAVTGSFPETQTAIDDTPTAATAASPGAANPPSSRLRFLAAAVGAGHEAAELAGGDGLGVELGDDAPAQHDEQPVAEPDQLVEVGGDQQRRQSFRARIAQDVPDRRLRADVDAPRRVGGDEHPRAGEHLPSDDQLLLVAARQREAADVDASGPHVELLDDPRRAFPGGGAIDETAPRERRAGLVTEDHIFPQAHRQHHPVTLTVLGDVPETGLAPRRVRSP
jgi:hypothetical protein